MAPRGSRTYAKHTQREQFMQNTSKHTTNNIFCSRPTEERVKSLVRNFMRSTTRSLIRDVIRRRVRNLIRGFILLTGLIKQHSRHSECTAKAL